MASLSDQSRELEILKLLVAGKTNKEVAIELCVCEKTVEFHLSNLYAKIGVTTRTKAVIWAMLQETTQETRDFP